VFLFSCTTKLFSRDKDNMQEFGLASQHVTHLFCYCIPGFFNLCPLM
jgi:hypothetical protein